MVWNGAGQFSIGVLDIGVVSTARNVKRLVNTRCLAQVGSFVVVVVVLLVLSTKGTWRM